MKKGQDITVHKQKHCPQLDDWYTDKCSQNVKNGKKCTNHLTKLN